MALSSANLTDNSPEKEKDRPGKGRSFSYGLALSRGLRAFIAHSPWFIVRDFAIDHGLANVPKGRYRTHVPTSGERQKTT